MKKLYSCSSDDQGPLLSRRRLIGSAIAATATFHLSQIDTSQAAANPLYEPDDLAQYDAMGLAKLVRERELSPIELLQRSIKRLEAVNPQINAIASKMYAISEASIKDGLPDGPFKGVPFLLKDISFPMRGVKSSSGSELFRDSVAKEDSTVVSRFRKAGLVIFARTQVPELGLLPTTESTFSGITRNPYDLSKTAGGSSGGSAAAVAAGIATMASASDGGGSIRIPASCCGLFGLKPTRARVPVGPDIFEVWGGLGVLHALTLSVRDSAALLDATAGPARGDSYAAPVQPGRFLDQVTQSPGRLRIALVKAMSPAQAPDPVCEQAVHDAAKLCESLGHEVEEQTDQFNRQFTFRELRAAHGKIVIVSLRRRIQKRLKKLGRELRQGDLEPVTRYYYDVAEKYTAVEIENCRTSFFRAARSMGEYQKRYDLILTPTLGTPPLPHGQITLTGTAQQVIDGLLKFNPCAAMANWTGQPAMSVPLYQDDQGLPIGVQFMGRYGDEATLLRMAGQLERALPWQKRRPNLMT